MWPRSSHTWPQDVSAWGRVRLIFCLTGSQPASKLASYNWPANQPCDKISTCEALGWSDGGRRTGSPTTLGPSPGSQHSHWFPFGSDPCDQGQASDTKCTLQPVIYCWHYFWGPFAVLYLCHLITHSCMKCREMLYRLFSLQTTLLISFYHQSDVLLNQGTTFEELLLSSQIRNAMEKVWPKVNMPKVVTYLATRCLYWGGGWGVRAGATSDQISTWPKSWTNVKLTKSSVTLGHDMSLLGAGGKRAWWYIWPKVSLTQRLTRCQADLT